MSERDSDVLLTHLRGLDELVGDACRSLSGLLAERQRILERIEEASG